MRTNIDSSGRDLPCDLHLVGAHYQQPPHTYRAADLENAGKVVYYLWRDRQEPDVDCRNIQPVVEHGRDMDRTIQAPFGVRPHYMRETLGVTPLPPARRDIDVLWCGLEGWVSPTTGRSRAEFLDEFQASLPGRVRFERSGGGGYKYSMKEYAELIGRSKIVLSLHGIAEHCYRYWEGMYSGGCVVGQRFVLERPWADIHEVMPRFLGPSEAAELCVNILESGNWQPLANEQNKWYHDNYNDSTYRRWAEEAMDRIL